MRRRIVIPMILVAIVVILRRRIEVMVMVVTLDVSIGKQQRGSGGGGLRGQYGAAVARDRAVPSRSSAHLRGGGEEAGAVRSARDAAGQVVVAVVAAGIVEEIGARAEAVAVDHATRSQVLVGLLDSEEDHHETCRQQLPEEEDDPKYDVGFTGDFLHISLIRNTVPAVVKRVGLVLQ